MASHEGIVYWYPCNILNIVVKGRPPKAAEVLQTVQTPKISRFALGMCQSRTSTKAILPHHFYALQLIETRTDAPDSELSTASLFLNLRPSTRARSVAQQSADSASVQVEPGDEIPRTFEELPRITINTREGRKKFVEAK